MPAENAGKSIMVFDVDGTLVGGEATDWASFEGAFEEAAGFVLDNTFFGGVTASRAGARRGR